MPSGTKWAACNVGANSPEEYGSFYAWGETEEKDDYSWENYKWCKGSDRTITKYCTNSIYGTVDKKTILEPEDDVAYVKWGSSWRMPTNEDFYELRSNCTFEWCVFTGVDCYKITSKINGESIYMPVAGYLNGTDLENAGIGGAFWSSSLRINTEQCAWGYTCEKDTILHTSVNWGEYWGGYERRTGRSVRPVCK